MANILLLETSNLNSQNIVLQRRNYTQMNMRLIERIARKKSICVDEDLLML